MNLLKFLTVMCLASIAGFAQQIEGVPSAVQKPSATRTEIHSSRIEHIFKFEDKDGYQGSAYQVIFQGQKVIVENLDISPPLAVGDTLNFLVMRTDIPDAPGGARKVIRFLAWKPA